MTQAELVMDLGSELRKLLIASRALTAASAASFSASLQPAAYQLALAISTKGSASARELVEMLDMDKSAVSRLAKSLCGQGLAKSEGDPDDRRSTIYSLTKKGLKTLQIANAIKSDVFFGRLEGWSDDELELFVGLLRKFNGS